MMIAGKKYNPELISVPCNIAEEIQKSFLTYASLYRKKNDQLYNRHMEVKQDHTIQVCKEIKEIGKSLGFNNEQLAFAEVIAWLHDIGRFEQFDTYGTFADAESENHSEIAVRVIENNNLLKDIDVKYKEIIYRSILNHNIPRVALYDTETIQYYSCLLRDADKLDIWRLSIEMDIFHKIKTETQPDQYSVPEPMLTCFNHNKTVSLDQVHSFYDSILYRISWIYDLNFMYSIRQVIARKIADKLIAKLPYSNILDHILEQVYSYMNNTLIQE